MNRAPAVAVLFFVATAATAWVPCEQKGHVPPKALQREAPAYPTAVRTIGIEGTVEIALTILRDGSVGWVRVVRADPRGYFEQAATDGVRRWRFSPALSGGAPVECRLRTRVRFALTDAAATAAEGTAGTSPHPVYPPALLAARIEGYAEVEYAIAADGTVTDARVAAAMPRGEFEQAALAAVRGWSGPPAAGDAPRRETRRFDFRLPDTMLDTVPATMLASAPFPMAACLEGTTGRVLLEVETDATGHVLGARILAAEPAKLFDETALGIARGSRLTPAYRDGQPIPATALLTLRFDPERATCPNLERRDHDLPGRRRPPPRVTGRGEGDAVHDEMTAGRAERWAPLPGDAG